MSHEIVDVIEQPVIVVEVAEAVGARGPKGDPGRDGLDGAPGVDGKDGADGKDGKDGADGLNGKNGLTPEIDPKTGEWIIVNKETRDTIFTHIAAKGRDGKDGVDGKDGADGKDGKDVINGVAHLKLLHQPGGAEIGQGEGGDHTACDQTRSGINTYWTPGSPGSSTRVGLAGSANLKAAVSPVI